MAKDTIIFFHPRTYPHNVIAAVPYEFLHLERMVRGRVRMIFIDEQVDPEYLGIIEENRDRLLLCCVSSMTGYQLIGGIAFSKAVKGSGNITVAWGGWHASLMPELTLKQDYIDLIISGQGEMAFQRLVESMLKGEFDRSIPNLGYKAGGETIMNPREPLRDPNTFPQIDFDVIDITRYITKKRFSDRTMWYISSFGCPSACSFCSMASVFGKAWWHRSADEVIRHLIYLKQKTGMGAVRFEDPTFFVNRDFTLDMCRRIIDAGLNIAWQANAQTGKFVRMFTADDIALMDRAGLRQLFIGAESGDPEVLRKINKNCTVDDNIEIVRRLKGTNIKPNLAVMVCFPWDPERDFRMTVKMVMNAKLMDSRTDVSLNVFRPMPGTPIYDEAIRHGFVPPDTMEGWAELSLIKFKAPWGPRNYLLPLRLIKKVYFPILTKGMYRQIRGYKKIIFLMALALLRPLFYLRFRSGSMTWPAEGLMVYYSIKWFNRITGLNWGLQKAGKQYQHKDL